jgi:hypothetical protein
MRDSEHLLNETMQRFGTIVVQSSGRISHKMNWMSNLKLGCKIQFDFLSPDKVPLEVLHGADDLRGHMRINS